MFKYWSIKKYGNKLQTLLEGNFGAKDFYNPSEVRSTVYKCDLAPKYLPLGYILYLNRQDSKQILSVEFPEIDPIKYQEEILQFLNKKSYQGSIQRLGSLA